MHVYASLINDGIILEAPNKPKQLVDTINSSTTAKYHSIEDFVRTNNSKYLDIYIKETKMHE